MAFGFGPGSDMVKSVQSNRKQLGRGKSLKENHDRFKDVEKGKLHFKKVSAEELESFKENFRKKKQKEDQQNLLILIAVFLMVFIAFYLILF